MNNLIKKWAKNLNRHLTKEDIQMANKHMRSCSTLYVIMELQIKTMRYHCTCTRMAKKQNTTPNAGKNVEQHELSFIADGNKKWHSLFGRQFGSFLQI